MMSCIGRDRECVPSLGKPLAPGNDVDPPPLLLVDNTHTTLNDAGSRSGALRTGASVESSPEPLTPEPPSEYSRSMANQNQIVASLALPESAKPFTSMTPSLGNEMTLMASKTSIMEQRLNSLEKKMIHHQVTVDAASHMMIQHQEALETMRRQLTRSEAGSIPDEFDNCNRQHAARLLERSMLVADSRLLTLEQKVAALAAKTEVQSLQANDLAALQAPLEEKLRSLQEDLRRTISSREFAQSAEKINLMEQDIIELKSQQPQYQQLQADLKALLETTRENENAKHMAYKEDLNREVTLEENIGRKVSTSTAVTSDAPEEVAWGKETPRELEMEAMFDLNGDVLDRAVMYTGNASVWDMALFIGLPHLGLGVSIMVALLYVMNVSLQVWFCVIISSFMLKSPADEDTLDGLLRFRGNVAHNVDYSDKVQHRSMVEQMCATDETLIYAGRQFTINDDMSVFHHGALPLSILTILCWMVHVLAEASETMHFLTAIWSLHRKAETTILTDHDRDSQHEQAPDSWIRKTRSPTDDAQASLIRVAVVVRVTGISKIRAILSSLCIGVPRVVIASMLGYIGIQFLANTSKMEDLLLNGMALAFICDLDELLYKFFMPRRAKTLMDNLEPLPASRTPWRRLKIPWLASILKLVLVWVGVFIVKMVMLDPFYDMLKQATDILCSGNRNFVVAQSVATGLLHAAATQEVDTSLENDAVKNVFALAKPILKNHSGRWELDGSVLDVSAVSEPVLMPRPTSSLDGAPLVQSAFNFVNSLSTMSVVGSDYLTCVDDAAGQSYNATVKRLQTLLQNSSIKGCIADSAFIQSRCAWMNMTSLRAICPQVCGCNYTLPHHVGYFAHPSWGCPKSCSVISTVFEQSDYPKRACADTRPPVFFLATPFSDLGTRDVMWDWYQTYIRTALNYHLSTEGYDQKVTANVKKAACQFSVLPCNLAANFTQHILSGAIIDTLLSGKWEFMPGVPHPRGVLGCEFLTSYELTFMLNIEFCADEYGSPMRAACPVSCGCGIDDGCPVACAPGKGVSAACVDMVDVHLKEARLETLRWLTGNPQAYVCSLEQHVLHPRCGQNSIYGKYAREVCPETCGCNKPFNHIVGFFGGSKFGCSETCVDVMNSWVALQHSMNPHTICQDLPTSYLLNTSDYYNAFPLWVRGLSDWLSSLGDAKQLELHRTLENIAIGTMISVPGLAFADIPAHVQFIMDGRLGSVILAGKWDLLPNVPHPRGKTGCAYITSYEFSLMLGIDVCGTDKFTSLRYACPVSCRCGLGMAQCPLSCPPSATR